MPRLTALLMMSALAAPLTLPGCAAAQIDPVAAADAETVPLRERRALEYVEAFNSGDADLYEAYMQANRTPEALAAADAAARAASFADLREMFAAFDVMGVVETPDGDLVLESVARSDEARVNLVFVYGEGDEARVDAIRFEPAAANIEIADDWEDLSSLLNEYQQLTGAPVWAAAVVTLDDIIDAGAAGGRDGAPASVDATPVFWGSVAKSVTGTMLGALIEQGVLDWETTVADIWPDADIHTDYRDVTLSDLMMHRSGAPPFADFNEEMANTWRDDYSGDLTARRAALVLDVLSQPPAYEPGTSWSYSNIGITAAGAMAEARTGRSWESLVDELVFAPIGMSTARSHVRFDPDAAAAAAPDDASDYERNRVDFGIVGAMIAPAGDVESSITDFARYAQMHLRGLAGRDGALSAETVMRLHAAPDDEISARYEPYGFGWGIAEAPDGAEMHWHNGGAGYTYAEARLFPEHGFAIVLAGDGAEAEFFAAPLWQAIYQRYVD